MHYCEKYDFFVRSDYVSFDYSNRLIKLGRSEGAYISQLFRTLLEKGVIPNQVNIIKTQLITISESNLR